MSSLLEKLKQTQSKLKKQTKKPINTNSAFATLTDEEITMVLAIRAKNARIELNKTQNDITNLANLKAPSTYSNFEQKGSISLLNFIKIVRSIGRLQELETLLQPTIQNKIEKLTNKQRQRVRK